MNTIRPKAPTLDDIKRMARELGVIFTDTLDSFTLVKQEPPLNQTYQKNRAGINAASTMLAWYKRFLQDSSIRLALAEEFLRQNPRFWHGTVNTMQRHVKKATSVELSKEEAFELRNKLSDEESLKEMRRIEEEEDKEQFRRENPFKTAPLQQSEWVTTIIGETSYGAEIELVQSNTETSMMFSRKKRRREINFVISNVAGEVDMVVLSVKNPRWPRILEKTTLSFEEARILRDLLTRLDISAWLERKI